MDQNFGIIPTRKEIQYCLDHPPLDIDDPKRNESALLRNKFNLSEFEGEDGVEIIIEDRVEGVLYKNIYFAVFKEFIDAEIKFLIFNTRNFKIYKILFSNYYILF